jgi:hypothetical protein
LSSRVRIMRVGRAAARRRRFALPAESVLRLYKELSSGCPDFRLPFCRDGPTFHLSRTERWQSGRMRLTRNQVCRKVPGVRIPPSPPLATQVAVVPRSGTAGEERLQRRDENEVRRSEAEKGRAKRECTAPAAGCQSLPFRQPSPFGLRLGRPVSQIRWARRRYDH